MPATFPKRTPLNTRKASECLKTLVLTQLGLVTLPSSCLYPVYVGDSISGGVSNALFFLHVFARFY